jgi:hypothetical protein
VDNSNVAQHRDQMRALMKKLMTFQDPEKAQNFPPTYKIIKIVPEEQLCYLFEVKKRGTIKINK